MWPFVIEMFFMFGLSIAIGFVTGKILRLKKPVINSHTCSVSFINSALVGFPIITAVFPERSGLYIAAYMIVETIMTCLLYTSFLPDEMFVLLIYIISAWSI